MLDRSARELSDTEKMVDAAEKLYGPYRWGRYDILVLPPSFPFGGMENPTLTFATPTIITGDKSNVDVIAHELAHSWSGNLVTNATWSDVVAQRRLHHLFRESHRRGGLWPGARGNACRHPRGTAFSAIMKAGQARCHAPPWRP